MNSNELINDLKLPKTRETLSHATKLLAIYSLIKTLNIDCVTVTENLKMNFGKKTEEKINWRYEWETLEIYSGVEIPANEISIVTDRGEYKFLTPVDCLFYSELCLLLKIGCFQSGVEAQESIIIESIVLEKIKLAAKFVAKKDEICNESMKHILLNIENGFCEVVASDLYRIYVSEKMECSGEDRQILIKPFTVKNTKDSLIQIDLMPDNTALIGGVKTSIDTDHAFPKFRSVMPEKTAKMTFDRSEFIDCTKLVLLASNKYSCLVKLHLNGNIEMTGHDIDMGLESIKTIPYQLKEFEDLDIGFNGIKLNECLNVFKSEKIDMYCTSPERAAQFTDGGDVTLLMPIMLNS